MDYPKSTRGCSTGTSPSRVASRRDLEGAREGSTIELLTAPGRTESTSSTVRITLNPFTSKVTIYTCTTIVDSKERTELARRRLTLALKASTNSLVSLNLIVRIRSRA